MARIETAVTSDGVVVYDGRAARIAGFGDGTVKLRFADGDTLNVALAVFARARHVRAMLNSYTTGRSAALHELGRAHQHPG